MQITIDRRFNGPKNSGNGGYCAGLFAETVGHSGPQTVRLLAPIPLDRELDIEPGENVHHLMDADTPLLELRNSGRSPVMPDAVKRYLGLSSGGLSVALSEKKMPDVPQSFGHCFVCGRERDKGDGLTIFSQYVEGVGDIVFAPWEVYDDLTGSPDNSQMSGEYILPRYLWAALDCPGYYACAAGEPALLASLSVEILRPLWPGPGAKVIGWREDSADAAKSGKSSRKRHCGTAILDADDNIVAVAHGIWVIVSPEYLASIAAE